MSMPLEIAAALFVYLGPLILIVLIVGGLMVLDLLTSTKQAETAHTAPQPNATAAPVGSPQRLAGVMGMMGATTEGRIMAERDEMAWLCQRLRESDVFEGLTDHELRLVASCGQRQRVIAGERLAHAGGRGDNVYVILEGELRLLTRGEEGELPVRSAHAGETVPLAVLLEPPLLVTTVEAAAAGEVFVIPRLRLLELFDLQPMIGLQVYRAAAKVFEGRYRKTLDGLVTALRSALQAAISGTEIAH